MPIDVREPEAAAAAQRQHRAEQDAAVAAEHQRPLARVEQLADPRGQFHRVAPGSPRRLTATDDAS